MTHSPVDSAHKGVRSRMLNQGPFSTSPEDTIHHSRPDPHVMRGLIQHGAFFAGGFLALSAQVLLLRELVVDVAGERVGKRCKICTFSLAPGDQYTGTT